MSTWHHIIDVLVSWGPYGLLLLAALDSAGLPVVGGVDSLLLLVAIRNPPAAYWSALCAVVGSLVGSLILFSVARKGGEVLLARHISGRTGAKLHNWFQRYGLITVFVPATSPVPLPMKVPVFCAGALNVRIAYFVFVVLLARVIRYAALAYFGMRYGAQTGAFLLKHGVLIGSVTLAAAVLVTLLLRLYQHVRVREGKPE